MVQFEEPRAGLLVDGDAQGRHGGVGVLKFEGELGQALHAPDQPVARFFQAKGADDRVGGLLLQVQLAVGVSDLPGLSGAGEVLHEPRLAVARDAVDHDESDRGLTTVQDMLVRIAPASVDHHEVGPLSGRDRPEHVVPLQDLRGIHRRHGKDVTRAEEIRLSLADQVRHLHLP